MKSKDFKKLQKKWYDKLKKSGFEDIEWVDHDSGIGQNSSYLKNSSLYLAKKYSSHTDTYYRFFRNFVCHATFASKIERNIAQWHSEGLSYRQIIKQIAKTHRIKRSVYFVYTKVNKLKKEMLVFQREHPEGMLNPANRDEMQELGISEEELESYK